MADIQRRAAHLSCTQASSALLDHPTMSSNIVVMYGTYFSYAPSLHPPLVPSADPGPASPLPGLLLFGAHRLDPSGCVIDGQAVEFVCFGAGRVGSRVGVTVRIGGTSVLVNVRVLGLGLKCQEHQVLATITLAYCDSFGTCGFETWSVPLARGWPLLNVLRLVWSIRVVLQVSSAGLPPMHRERVL